jgi:hypothetical protein
MDARAHVQAGLVRLLAGDRSLWPVADRQRFLHRLLDETGSDHRALAVLLMRAHDVGVPEQLERAKGRGTPWGESASPHIVGLASEHFIQPEMARWAVESWGMALGCYVAPKPLPAPASRAAAAPWRGGTSGTITPPAGAQPARGRPKWQGPPAPNPPGTPGWVKPGKIPAQPRYISGSLVAPPPGAVRLPGGASFTKGELRAIAILGTSYIAGMVLLAAGIRSVRADEMAQLKAREGARAAGAPMLPRVGTAQVTAPTPALRPVRPAPRATAPVLPPVERRVGSAPNVAALAADAAGNDSAVLPEAMRPWRGIYEPARAREIVAGRWQVRGDVHGVGGSRSCEAVWRSLSPGRESVESIAVVGRVPGDDPQYGRIEFAFTSRPGLQGTIRADGSFESVPMRSMRDGVRYEFRMAGRFADGAFEAETETVTRTVLKFGDPQVCSVRSRLSGRRLGASE